MGNEALAQIVDYLSGKFNMNEKQALRQIKLAQERGKKPKDFTRSLEKNYLYAKCNCIQYALVYNGNCFIFEYGTDRVLEVRELPNWWEKKNRFVNQKYIRNAKVYYRLNGMEEAV